MSLAKSLLITFLGYIVFLVSTLYLIQFALYRLTEKFTLVYGLVTTVVSLYMTYKMVISVDSRSERISLSIFYIFFFSFINFYSLMVIGGKMNFMGVQDTNPLIILFIMLIGIIITPLVTAKKVS